jgi:hypothetical protein
MSIQMPTFEVDETLHSEPVLYMKKALKLTHSKLVFQLFSREGHPDPRFEGREEIGGDGRDPRKVMGGRDKRGEGRRDRRGGEGEPR